MPSFYVTTYVNFPNIYWIPAFTVEAMTFILLHLCFLYLSHLECLSLNHIMQWLLAATVESTVDETTMCPPFLTVVPQRDGAPSSRHNISWYSSGEAISKVFFFFLHIMLLLQRRLFYLCMKLASQQSLTIFSLVLLLWYHYYLTPPWLKKHSRVIGVVAFWNLKIICLGLGVYSECVCAKAVHDYLYFHI